MSNIPYYRPRHRTPALDFAQQIAELELFWPLSLLAVAILRIDNPLIVGGAIVIALIPWLTRLIFFRYLTRPVFMGGAMGLLVISSFVGLWASYDPTLSWPLILTLLASVFLFFAVANASLSPRAIAKGLVIIAGLLAFYFVGQYGYFDLPLEVGRVARLGRITGSILPEMVFYTPHPNAVAGFLEGTLILSLVLIWRTQGPERVGWALITMLIAYGLFISASRGAWLGLMVAMGLWGLLSLPNRRMRLAAAGLAVLVIAGGIWALAGLVQSGYQSSILTSLQETANSRLTLYENSLYLIKDYIFTGLGPGDTFAMVYSRYLLLIPVPFLTYTHNLFLSVWLGQGIFGLIGLIWLLVSFYRFVIQIEWVGLRERWQPIFRAAWLGVTASFIHGLTDSPHFGGADWTMPMLFALMGLVIATGHLIFVPDKRDKSDKRVDASFGRLSRWEWAGLGLLGTISLVGAILFWQPIVGAAYANLGTIQHTRSDLSPNLDDAGREVAALYAAAYYTSALGFDPDQTVANRRLGLLALDRHDFETAITYLEPAYAVEPGNQGTVKALGLAYLWHGQLDLAETLLRQVERHDEMVTELGTWSWWWGTQDRPDLSTYAGEMAERLSGDNQTK